MQPYFQNDAATIYHGDMRDITPTLGLVDLVVTDPPYVETRFKWDVWPDGWPEAISKLSSQLWSFGSARMFFDRHAEFASWEFVQDLVWEKQNGTSLHADRFRRVHENIIHFRRRDTKWKDCYKEPLYSSDAVAKSVRRKRKPQHWGQIAPGSFRSEDGGPRIMRSVLFADNCHGFAKHPTQKPEILLSMLLTYSLAPGGTVLDPFLGSGSTVIAAMKTGRKAIGIDINEKYCELAAKRIEEATTTLFD